MLDPGSSLLLVTALGLGLMHAFDADHIMAVSSLSQKGMSARNVMKFCGRWAVGHGLTLCCLAWLLISLDWQLGASAGVWAERLIGLLLVGAGVSLLWRCLSPSLTLRAHRHGDVTHTHWVKNHSTHEKHLPILVGIVHGVAGSAPLLAALPTLMAGNTSIAGIYVAVFSLGILLSMSAFGLCLGIAQNWLQERSQKVFHWSKGLLGAVATILGCLWLANTI